MTTSDVIFTSWHPRTLFNESAGSQPAPEELRQQARDEGYTDGYNEGLEAGKKESFERANAKVAQLQSLIDALDQPFKKEELQVSEYLLSMVSSICRAILRRELSTDIGHIQITLDRALDLLSGQKGTVTLSLHPDDAATVSDNWTDELGELRIIAAPEITRGGCLIQRNDSLVDATIECQLRKMIVDLSLAADPMYPPDETGSQLDIEQIDLTSQRLEQRVNPDE